MHIYIYIYIYIYTMIQYNIYTVIFYDILYSNITAAGVLTFDDLRKLVRNSLKIGRGPSPASRAPRREVPSGPQDYSSTWFNSTPLTYFVGSGSRSSLSAILFARR